MNRDVSDLPYGCSAVVDTSLSSNAKLRPVPISKVRMRQGFWRKRMEANYKAGIPVFLAWLERDNQTAPFPTFARTKDAAEIQVALEAMRDCFVGRNEQRLLHCWRAVVMKTIEACAFVLQSKEVPRIRELLDNFVAGIVAAHENQNFWDDYYGKDFENSYQFATPGHLIQAAIAHHRSTGSREFLDCACRVADVIIEKYPDRTCVDHPCIEMALVELYRATGKKRYLEQARRFLQALIQQPGEIGKGNADYMDDPKKEHCGKHVVRQTYLCAGGADYLAETGDASFRDKLEAIWQDMTSGKIQITGQLAIEFLMPERITAKPFQLSAAVFGVLLDHVIRGFELCEAVGNIFWNWRMLAVTGDAKYADLFERILYNGFLAHVSLDGASFHYVSPLATDGDFPPRNVWGNPESSCCPPNALRMIASVLGYIFSTSDEGLWVHLYDNCCLDWHLEDSTPLRVVQKTRYPWNGEVAIEVIPGKPTQFALNLRIPGWCSKATVKINGKKVNVPIKRGSYCKLERCWKKGDVVMLDMSMPVVAMGADTRACDFQGTQIFKGKAALMRGPLVYCFEGVDNPDIAVWSIRLRVEQGNENRATQARLYEPIGKMIDFEAVFDESLLKGVVALKGACPDGKGGMTRLKAVPYYAWYNREVCPMRVWVGM